MQLGVCTEAARRGVSAARLLSTGDSFALHRFTATRRRREVIAPCGVRATSSVAVPHVSLRQMTDIASNRSCAAPAKPVERLTAD